MESTHSRSQVLVAGTKQEAGGEQAEISTHIRTHYSEIVQYLNYEELMGYLREENLLSEEQLRILISSDLCPPKKGSFILETIIAKGKVACEQFYSCLRKEISHLGHAYIARLLEGKEFSADKEAMSFSLEIKKQVRRHHNALRDMDFSTLVPVMLKHDLLTPTESKVLLSNEKTQAWKAAQLELILGTKGPLAYHIFVQCLGEEDSHPTHYELCSLFNSDESSSINSDSFEIKTDSATNRRVHHTQGKHRIERSNSQDITLPKRRPREFKLEGPLAGKRYSRLMLTFQTCHHNGDWCKLEIEVQKVLRCGIPELSAVALLEEAISHIFRQNREKVLDCVDQAQKLIKESPEIQQSGGNTRILQARCEHVVSCLYRYAKEYKEAFHHATNALAHLAHANSSEDKSFAFYCSACIRLESYTEGVALDETSPEQIKEDFRLAIDFARSHNIGMDVVEPHSHIRLAQQCLGSTQFQTGQVTNRDRIREASNSLGEVNADMLSQRSKSLFYLLKSDLYMNEGKTEEAIGSAITSLELSKNGKFAIEKQSAEARLQLLKSRCV